MIISILAFFLLACAQPHQVEVDDCSDIQEFPGCEAVLIRKDLNYCVWRIYCDYQGGIDDQW